MKVFISHKNEDSMIASYICKQLINIGVVAYLDVLEGNLLLKGEDLTNHIKGRLNSCTDILVVMSSNTKESWWVPFEIGMAAQRDFPIVTYLVNNVEIPDYLSYWPVLKKTLDLSQYVAAKEYAIKESADIAKSMYRTDSIGSTQRFYNNLKQRLHQ